jgi:hypothetical protein
MYKLSLDEAEELASLIEQDGFAVLTKKVLPQILEKQASRVLSASDADLIKERACYNGMVGMIKMIEALRGNPAKP